VTDILLLDVTPLSLGVETLGGITTKITPRNTIIPAKKFETFSTAADNQPNVDIHVLQGERELAKDNKSLGTFRLEGIPPAARGVPQIQVTFDIDANGILSVTARDEATNQQQSITISGASTLPKDEVERMVKDAESNAKADKEKLEQIGIKNKAEELCYRTKSLLEKLESTITSEEKQQIEAQISELEQGIQNEDYSSIEDLINNLEKTVTNYANLVNGDKGTNSNNPSDTVVDTEVISEE
jgi:molecular chaperone DnaK